MTERWTPSRTSVVRSCADAACPLFGIPNVRQARHTVTLNDQGDVVGHR